MARILLGVSGGIAAYKALELARLATLAGHGVRVLMTPAAKRFVGSASFEGIVGAPVLDDEFERDPLRGAFPGDPLPDHDPIGHLELAANADAVPDRARLREHDRQARGRDRRLDADHLVPRLPGAARRCSGDERPHVRGPRHPGEPGDAARARRAGDRARGGRARLAGRDRRGQAAIARAAAGRGRGAPARRAWLLGRTAGAGHRRRNPGADRLGPLHRQPLERPDGAGAGRTGQAAWGRGDPGRGQRLASRAGRRAADRRRDGGRAGGRGAGGVPGAATCC